MGEPTREGVRATVLRLRRGHAGDDTSDTSRVFWAEQVHDGRKDENDDDNNKRKRKTRRQKMRFHLQQEQKIIAK